MLIALIHYEWLMCIPVDINYDKEIKGLLSRFESDHLILLGTKQGLERSKTVTTTFDLKYGVYREDGVTYSFNTTEWNSTFSEYDHNKDGLLDQNEALKCVPGLDSTKMELTPTQLQTLYNDMDIDADSNGHLDLREFWVLHNRGISAQVREWVARLQAGEMNIEEEQKNRDRISEQAWVPWYNSQDKLLQDLPNRLVSYSTP